MTDNVAYFDKNGKVDCRDYRQTVSHGATKFERMELRIREARKAARMSQEELGRASGIARSQISDFERGVRYPTTRHIDILAKALGVDPEAILPKGNIGKRAANIIRALEGLPEEDWDEVEKYVNLLLKARQKGDAV